METTVAPGLSETILAFLHAGQTYFAQPWTFYQIGIIAGWNAILGPLAMAVMRWSEVDRGPVRGVAW